MVRVQHWVPKFAPYAVIGNRGLIVGIRDPEARLKMLRGTSTVGSSPTKEHQVLGCLQQSNFTSNETQCASCFTMPWLMEQ